MHLVPAVTNRSLDPLSSQTTGILLSSFVTNHDVVLSSTPRRRDVVVSTRTSLYAADLCLDLNRASKASKVLF